MEIPKAAVHLIKALSIIWSNQCLQSTKRLQKLSSEHTQKECRQMEEDFRVSGDMHQRLQNLWKQQEIIAFVMHFIFSVIEHDFGKQIQKTEREYYIFRVISAVLILL